MDLQLQRWRVGERMVQSLTVAVAKNGDSVLIGLFVRINAAV